MKRLLTILATLLMVMVVEIPTADAGPQWRLRRWSSRPPIDPTIRTTPRFSSSASYSNHYNSSRSWRSARWR